MIYCRLNWNVSENSCAVIGSTNDSNCVPICYWLTILLPFVVVTSLPSFTL